MPSRRAPRASVLAAIVASMLTSAVAVPGTFPARAAEPAASRLLALRAVRVDRPKPLRGVLAGIAQRLADGGPGRADLEGLITRRTAAGVTQVAVSIRADAAGMPAVLERLKRLGMQIANRNERAVEAYVSPAVLDLVARLPGVEAVEPILPMNLAALVGPGAPLHGASLWQGSGYEAAGIKVGIIDGGFTGMTQRLGVELPATVNARCYTGVGSFSSTLAACESDGVEHGTAVAETIVDMAPGVELFVSNPLSLQDYQRTVTWMTSNGVRIINASLATAYQGPGDGSDPTGASLYTVIAQASAAGALWVNSAGNSGENGWVGPWADPDGDDFLNFAGGDEENGFPLWAGQQVIVTARWNEPWGRSRNDYDIGVFDPSGDLVASSVDTQDGNDDPVETLVFEAPVSGIYTLVATRHLGAAVSRFQVLVLTNGESPLEHLVEAGTIPSPVDSRASGFLTVGAVDVASPASIQPYSSRGPTLDGRVKPDLVAGDCGSTTVIGTFCGTSQSAPHVAGAAALVLDAFPKYTAGQIAAFLRSRAVPLGDPVPNSTYGHGRLDLGLPPGPPVPVAIAYQVQPGQGVEGQPLAKQPVVRIVDADGAAVDNGPGATLPVTLALAPNPTGAVLTCGGGTTVAAQAGVATFSACAVDRPGQYTLAAAAGALPVVVSAPFTVTGVPVVLAFAAGPGDGPAGSPLAPGPVVNVTNGSGALHTGSAATLPVTLALGANGGSATLACAGGTTVAAVDGVATFAGCTVDAPGGGYTLVATAPGATAAATSPFTLLDPSGVLPVPQVSLSPSSSVIRWGETVRLDARLSPPTGGPAPGGRVVRFQRTGDGITWSDIGTALTDPTGAASIAYRPAVNHWYRASVLAATDLAAATSGSSRVVVRQLISLRPTGNGRVTVVPRGSQVAFRTTVRPARADAPPGDVTLQVYRKVGSRWALVASEVTTPDGSGVATMVVTFDTAGAWYVRSQANPTPLNANSGWSRVERYDVR